MVYCGPPSKGCWNCRERKIKCDQVKPSCTKCNKTRRVCLGYEDQSDFMFRDESERIIKRERAKKITDTRSKPKKVNKGVRRVKSIQDQPRRAGAKNSWTSISHLVPAMEDRALSFFCLNYIAGDFGPVRLVTDHIPSFTSNNDIEEHLLASMKAVGFASLSHLANSTLLMNEGLKSYTKAISLVNIALGITDRAKKDSTLLSIMILTIFEHTIGCHQRSVTACEEHISGAAALLQCRGREQLQSLTGRRLFLQTSATLLVSCIQRQIAMPQDVLDLRDELRPYADVTSIPWRVQESAIAFAEFRAKMRDGRLSDTEEILLEALGIDDELVSIFDFVSPDWQYETVSTDADPDLVFGGFYHLYKDFEIAQIWNAWRLCRLLLHEVVRDVLQEAVTMTHSDCIGPYIVDQQYRRSTDILRSLQADILASVPQHVGYSAASRVTSPSSHCTTSRTLDSFFDISSLDQPSTDCTPISNGRSRHTPILRSGGSHFLIWPLYLAGSLDIATASDREWAANCLRYIGKSAAVQRATLLADLLQEKQKLEPRQPNSTPAIKGTHPCTSPHWQSRCAKRPATNGGAPSPFQFHR